MNKKEIETELHKILKEAEEMKKQSELELASSKFLQNEANKLIKERARNDISSEHKNLIEKNVNALRIKINYEAECLKKSMTKLDILKERMDYLMSLADVL